MTFPVTLFNIHAHFIFEILAYFLGFRLYLYLRKQQTDAISDDNRLCHPCFFPELAEKLYSADSYLAYLRLSLPKKNWASGLHPVI